MKVDDINKKIPDGLKSTGEPYKVLIVDDSAFVVKQLTQILASEKYEVVDSASNGLDAINKYKELKGKIDLVTMDITMPDMNGIEALKKIIEFDPEAKVVMITALGTEKLVKEALMLGAKGYIVKPLNRAKVLERIKAILK